MAILFTETSEFANFLPKTGNTINVVHNTENCNSGSTKTPSPYDWTLKKVSSPAFSGSNSIHVEIRQDQPKVGTIKRIRSEITVFKPDEDVKFSKIMPDVWYSYCLYFPSVGMENDPNSHDSITQWFEDGGADTCMVVVDGKLYLELPNPTTTKTVRYDMFGEPFAVPANSTSEVKEKFQPLKKDVWTEFTFHFIHAPDAKGVIEVWRNGVKIQDIRGVRNMHTNTFPKWKIGLYKSDYTETPMPSIRPYRIINIDNVKVGDSATTLSQISSFGNVPQPPIPPTPSATTSTTATTFNFINSATDTILNGFNIVNNATYSLKTLGLTKTNILFNYVGNKPNKFVYNLTGKMKASGSDKSSPNFCLWGDDGATPPNFYYGSWNPPPLGTYTLKATPVDANGSSGTSATVTWTFIA